MLPWVLLDTAQTPGGAALRLLRRGTEYSIRLQDGNELMNSRLGGSEQALATLAIPRIPAPRVLIGGLGMGFTLRAALALTDAAARLDVAEIVPELIDWAHGPMAEVFGPCLADPRVTLHRADVGLLIRAAANAAANADADADADAFDAILLDVDNGPDGLTRPDNEGLYSEAGLHAARRALRPGGVLAVWSAAPDPRFTRRLTACGFVVRVESVRAGQTRRGARHTIWRATRPPDPAERSRP